MANTINGVDLLTVCGFTVDDPKGFLEPPPASMELIHVINAPGARARAERVNERPFGFAGDVVGADNAAAKAYLRLLNALVLRGVRGTLEIVLEDRPTYYVRAKYAGMQARAKGPAHLTRGYHVDLSFTVADPPSWISTSLSTITSIGASDVSVPMGTAAPYSPVLAIYTPTNPTITRKDHNGATIGTPMAFTFTPGAGEYLVIDIGLGAIYRNTSGLPSTGTECSALWTPGTSFVGFDYHDWDPISGSYGSIAISSGTGELTYYPCDF